MADCAKEKAPGTAATVTSAGKEHPQPKDTTMSTESKELDRETIRILESIDRFNSLSLPNKMEIVALIDALWAGQINKQQAGG